WPRPSPRRLAWESFSSRNLFSLQSDPYPCLVIHGSIEGASIKIDRQKFSIVPCRISSQVRIGFSVDLHVRTPKQIARGLKEGDCDWFLREVMEKGRVLYESPGSAMGVQGGTVVGHPKRDPRDT